jgi:hypothetical protein
LCGAQSDVTGAAALVSSGNYFRQTHIVLATIGTFPVDDTEFSFEPSARRNDVMRYALLWLLGVPIPVLIVIYLLFH